MTTDHDHAQMGRFLFDIWTIIVQKSNDESLVTLSSVCRVLRVLAQETLYKKVGLAYYEDDTPYLSLLNRSLSERPKLAELIHVFMISQIGRISDTGRRTFREILAKTLTLLRTSPAINLRFIHISNMNIDPMFRDFIHSLPHLRRCSFTRCCVSDGDFMTMPPNPANHTTTRLMDLELETPESKEGWWTMVPGGLRSLTLSGIIDDSIFSDLMSHGKTSTLTELCLYSKIPLNIVDFLMSSPQLRRIQLSGHSKPSHPILSLPSDAIPLLESYTGLPKYAPVLIGGRPVHTIKLSLTYEDKMENIRLPLQSSSVPVTNLFLNGGDEHEEFLLHAPTTLQHLLFGVLDAGLQALIPLLSRFTVLQILELDIMGEGIEPHLEESEQGDVVRAISDVCPSVCEILFEPREPMGGIGTTRKWRKSFLGHWELYTVYHDYCED